MLEIFFFFPWICSWLQPNFRVLYLSFTHLLHTLVTYFWPLVGWLGYWEVKGQGRLYLAGLLWVLWAWPMVRVDSLLVLQSFQFLVTPRILVVYFISQAATYPTALNSLVVYPNCYSLMLLLKILGQDFKGLWPTFLVNSPYLVKGHIFVTFFSWKTTKI